MSLSARAWWRRPQAYLYAWNFRRDSACFLPVEREVISASSFLDQRIAADLGRLREIAITELLDAAFPDPGSAPAFLFHTGFCCSTLLARSIDLPGRSLVLREPTTLLQLSDLARDPADVPKYGDRLLGLTLDLLCRPFRPAERVVVKPTNVAGNLAPDLLALRPDGKALVLFGELEPFLLSILKRPDESRKGIGQFLSRFLADARIRGQTVPDEAPAELAERAALAWLLQIRGLREWLQGESRARTRTLDVDELLAKPAAALEAAAAWLEIPLAHGEAAAIVTGPQWHSHAKDQRLAYDPVRRRNEQTLARRVLAEPIRDGLAYARYRFGTQGTDFPPELRLLP